MYNPLWCQNYIMCDVLIVYENGCQLLRHHIYAANLLLVLSYFAIIGATYITKIDGVVCPPNISETVAVRTMKLAHRPRIAWTTIKFISKPILLSIL